jgi:Putative transposase
MTVSLPLPDDRVQFRWRDYADGDRVKVMDLDVAEFLRRFLLRFAEAGGLILTARAAPTSTEVPPFRSTRSSGRQAGRPAHRGANQV